MPYCPECGGQTHYDSTLKRYVCKSCGLSLTSQEIMELQDRLRPELENEEEKERKKRKEYLSWWLSKKG
jgi:transcription initiation factor TFIIIB Brf1 subunit/transcription initiation factor TFIIB